MTTPRYGLAAEFAEAEGATRAAQAAREAGFKPEAYGPFPVPELAEATGFREKKIAPAVLVGGLVGALSGYALQYYCTVLSYPHNIGGRPFHSWPSFIPITFELGILGATFSGIAGLLVLNRLPLLSHPVFAIPGFERATRDRFFVCIPVPDGDEDLAAAEAALRAGDPVTVHRLWEKEEA